MEYLADGLRRSEIGSHVVFYRVDTEDILIVRVLHQAMDALRHF